MSVYDALPLTRLEGLKDVCRQLAQHKDQMADLMRASQGTDVNDMGYLDLCLFKRVFSRFLIFNSRELSLDSGQVVQTL